MGTIGTEYLEAESQLIAAIENVCHLAIFICDVDGAAIHQKRNGRWTCVIHAGNTISEISWLDESLTSRTSFFTGNYKSGAEMRGGPKGSGFDLCIPFEEIDNVLCVSHCQPRKLNEKQLDALTRLTRQAETILRSHHNIVLLETADRKGTDLYKSFFEHLEEGIFQTTPDGHYIAANPKLASIYGYDSANQLIDDLHNISEQLYVRPGRRSEFVRSMQKTDVITNFESQIRRRDGKEIWISENVRAVRNDKGEVVFYEGTVVDITGKRSMEDALRESELLYHSLVESIPQNILRKDLDGRFIFANNNFCTLMERSWEEIKGRTDHDLFPDELADKYRRDDLRVLETAEIYDTIEEHEIPGGGAMHVHVIKTPLSDVDGNITGIQCMFWDVTQRKRVEEELAFERDLLRALLDNVPDRIYFKDTVSRFVRCSRALADRLGLNMPEEAIGKTDYDFHPEKEAREFHEDETRVMHTGEAVVNKVEKQTGKDGQSIWASVTKVPFRNRAGILTGIIGISRDITALKHAEEEMAHARDLAQESAQLKAQFLATMSHEIRTPMNGVIGMIDLLLSTKLDDEQREYSEQVQTSAVALLEILNDILDLSKIEAGHLKLESTQFNLRELVEDVLELYTLKAQEKGVDLACYVPAGCKALFKGDSGRLRQILLNLVSNSVKFTEQGTVRLTVNLVENNLIRFEVSDTGVGVSRELQSSIFEAFRQADGSTTRKYGGTGLGLAISRELVELMKGELGVESEDGSGSKFWFEVPLEKIDAPSEGELSELNGKSLILGVPDGFVRRALSDFANGWGVKVETVVDVAAAQRLISSSIVIDFVLLDLDLPGGDCLDLVKFIQQHSPNARVILMTTRTNKFDVATIHAMGVSGALVKPVKYSRMKEALIRPNIKESSLETLSINPSRARILRVLVIEDNEINQRVAQLQLEKLHCQVKLRSCGEAVLDEELSEFDLIFMDCHMPGMDGFEATRKIREMESGVEPSYIIAMTANAREADRKKCIMAGMNDFISKPVQLAELGKSINKALGGGIPESLAKEVLPRDTLREILPLYIKQARELVTAIHAAEAAKDNKKIREISHQLKGSSANIGARAFAELCGKLENAATREDSELVYSMLPMLKVQLGLVESELSRIASA